MACYFDPGYFKKYSGLSEELSPQQLRACFSIDVPLMVEAMEQLFRELNTPGFSSDLMVESLGHVLLIEIGRYLKSKAIEAPTQVKRLSPRHLERLQEYIEQSCAQRLSIRDMAKACDLSGEYLRHAFKGSVGQSLSDYVSEIRIGRAKSLLAERKRSLKQIAHLVGFASAKSFSSAFRRVTGMTPKAYQKQTPL